MSAVWYRSRVELRRRWVATLVLAVLAALAGGVVLASLAGARRTSSAIDRFLAYHRPYDVNLEVGEELDLDALSALPGVVSVASGAYVLMAPSLPDGTPDTEGTGSVNPFLVMPESGEPSARLLVAEGRLPDWESEPLEVAVDQELAERSGVGPGDTLRMWGFAPEQLEQISTGGIGRPEGKAYDFEVAAVIRTPSDVVPNQVDQDIVYMGQADLYLGRAWYERYGDGVAAFGPEGNFAVRLQRGQDDAPGFVDAVRALPGGEDAFVDTGSEATAAADTAQDAIDVQVSALYAFAGLAAVAGFLVVGQALARQLALEHAEHPVLRAAGMTTAQLVAVAAVRALAIASLGAVLAVVMAVALSPLFPIGLARDAEIDPGLAVDPALLALGGLALVTLLVARVGVAAVTEARRRSGAAAERRSRLADRLAQTGAAAPVVTGVRLALEAGGGRSAVPLRGALVGAALGAGAVVAAAGFGASLDHLVGTPALQGWAWDVVVGNGQELSLEEEGTRLLAANPNVGAFAAYADQEDVRIGGKDVLLDGLGTGEIGPTLQVVEGRAPLSAREIALGESLRRELGADIGDRVEVVARSGPRELTIVGTALFFRDQAGDADRGAVVTLDGMRALGIKPFVSFFAVDYAPGVEEKEAFRSLRADFGRTVVRPYPPPAVANLQRVSGLPVVLAALIGLLAVGTLGHALVTSVRRRRGDLAVLRTLGFLGRQLSATIAWQATTVVVLALVVGLPLGVAAGRWSWEVVADGLGTPAPPVVPVLVVLVALPATLAVANLIAALPARAAAHTEPAVVFRSE